MRYDRRSAAVNEHGHWNTRAGKQCFQDGLAIVAEVASFSEMRRPNRESAV